MPRNSTRRVRRSRPAFLIGDRLSDFASMQRAAKDHGFTELTRLHYREDPRCIAIRLADAPTVFVSTRVLGDQDASRTVLLALQLGLSVHPVIASEVLA